MDSGCRHGGTRISSTATTRFSEHDRAAASQTHPVSSASCAVHGDGRVPATTSVKAASSARKASAKRSMKNTCGTPAGKVLPGSTERRGNLSSKPTAMLSAEPWSLEAHVVAPGVVARVRHQGLGLVVEGQDGRGGGDVAELVVNLVAATGAGGVGRDDLTPGHPPDRVEVVHRAVAEDAARARQVLPWRGRRVEGRRAHRVHPAELPGPDGLARGDEARVEAPREADLHRNPGVGQAADHVETVDDAAGERRRHVD